MKQITEQPEASLPMYSRLYTVYNQRLRSPSSAVCCQNLKLLDIFLENQITSVFLYSLHVILILYDVFLLTYVYVMFYYIVL